MSTYIKANDIKFNDLYAVEGMDYYRKFVNHHSSEHTDEHNEMEEFFERNHTASPIETIRAVENMSRKIIEEEDNEKAVFRSARLLTDSYIPMGRHSNNFENFEASTDTIINAKRDALEFINDIDGVKSGRNLIIAGYGSVGTGKTHLAIAVANKAIKEQIPTVFINSTTMMSQMRKDFDVSPYINTGLLIIDDLGKENKTSWVSEQLYLILDSRHNSNKPTIITTENTIEYLEAQFGSNGKALMSRLCANFTLIKCTGDDYRLKRN